MLKSREKTSEKWQRVMADFEKLIEAMQKGGMEEVEKQFRVSKSHRCCPEM